MLAGRDAVSKVIFIVFKLTFLIQTSYSFHHLQNLIFKMLFVIQYLNFIFFLVLRYFYSVLSRPYMHVHDFA